VPRGKLGVAPAVGQGGEVGEQADHVRRVEHRAAQDLVALEQPVAGEVAQVRHPPADALGHREAVQPVGGRALRELVEQLPRARRTRGERAGRVAAEPIAEPLPVRRELADRRVELPQRPVLGRVQPLGGRHGHW
jgi:hypothetical protein